MSDMIDFNHIVRLNQMRQIEIQEAVQCARPWHTQAALWPRQWLQSTIAAVLGLLW